MRTLLIAAAFIAHTATAAVTFPPPLLPEQAVSQRTFGPAACTQQTAAVSSNGQIAFAVWFDYRGLSVDTFSYGSYPDLYGSRISADGVSLDPAGILIARRVTGGSVFWNGTAFVVISELYGDKTFSFVSPEGSIDRKSTGKLHGQFAAILGSGPSARILFAGGGLATVLDSQANVVMADVQLFAHSFTFYAAAGSGSEFLILYSTDGKGMRADRVGRDGKFLGSADTGLVWSQTGGVMTLAGGPDEYLLASRGSSLREEFLAHLDRNGVKKSIGRFAPHDSTLRFSGEPAVLFDGDGYQIAWTTSEADGSAHTWLAGEPAGNGTPALPLVQLLAWTGTGYGTVMTTIGSTRVVVSDAFRSGVSTSVDPIVIAGKGSAVLSTTASLQAAPQAASSGNAYATIWNEYGPDGSNHLFLRRFSQASSGAPLDAAPIEVASDPDGQTMHANIAAAGDTYVIAWAGLRARNYVVRRLSATTGHWLDEAPVPLANAEELVLGSNGEGVLAVYAGACPDHGLCLRVRTIFTDSGAPLRTNETAPAGSPAYDLAIASNGHDYLLTWNDNYCQPPTCDTPSPSHLLALRLRADGSAIDQAPAILNTVDFDVYPSSVAWTGSRYVVSWTDDYSASIVGLHVSAGGGTDSVRQIAHPSQILSQRLFASGGNLLLLTGDGVTTWGVAVDPESLAATGESTVLVTGQPPYPTFSAAALPGGGVVTAYERIDPAANNVSRVFTRVFGSIQRRRAAR